MDSFAQHEREQQPRHSDTASCPADLGLVLLQSQAGANELAQPRAGLSLPQRRLLSLLDGRSSLAALADADNGLQSGRVGRDAQRLLALGLAEGRSAAASIAARPTPQVAPSPAPQVVRAPSRAQTVEVAGRRGAASTRRAPERQWRLVPLVGAALTLSAVAFAAFRLLGSPPTVQDESFRGHTGVVKAAPTAADQPPVLAPAATSAAETRATAASATSAGSIPKSPSTESGRAAAAVAGSAGQAARNERAQRIGRTELTERPGPARVASQPAALGAARNRGDVASRAMPEIAVPPKAAEARTPPELHVLHEPNDPAAAAKTMATTAPRPQAQEAGRGAPPARAEPPGAVALGAGHTAPGAPLQLAARAPPSPPAAFAPIERIAPVYPRDSSLRSGESITVRARLVIDVDGAVERVELLNRNDRVFERASIAALQRWRFPNGAGGRRYEAELVFRAE